MTEKTYKRQRSTIIAIIIVAVVLIVAAIVGIIHFSNNTKAMPAGDDSVKVENYVGKIYEEVSSRDLTFEKVEVFSNEEKGVVIQQSISEGTMVKRGTVITLNVSKGDSEVEVPSVVGMTEDEAVKALKDNGFEVSVRYIINAENKPAGTVKECSPAEGQRVSFGSKVSISVWGDDLSITTTTEERPTGETAAPTTTAPTTTTTTEATTTTTTTAPTTTTTTEAESEEA
ncbi:MAG: PASTA domain-containing protein [Clostridia bacterium]|nr:PASTA domain-containing protein [Clostridia bacterium]